MDEVEFLRGRREGQAIMRRIRREQRAKKKQPEHRHMSESDEAGCIARWNERAVSASSEAKP